MSKILGIVLGLIAGFSVAIQSYLNNKLSSSVGTVWTIFTSHIVGAVFALAIIWFIPNGFQYMGESIGSKFQSAPWYSLLGGVMGVIIVGSMLSSFKTLSIGQALALITLGQLLLVAVFEHFGFCGITVNPLDYKKVIGILLMVGGTYLLSSKE